MKNKFRLLAMAVLALTWTSLPVPALAADLKDGTAIPHVGESGLAGYGAFVQAEDHKAFVIAPGGAWAWVSGNATVEGAEAEARAACRQDTRQPCQLYASDDQVVFDAAAWAASWDLHQSAVQAEQAPLGTGRGDRFPDLALGAPDGRAMTLGDLRGTPVFLHFWGSWCPPCQTEFVDLQRLFEAVGGEDGVKFVLVQGRESIAKSRRWAQKRGFTMPLYDSGAQGHGDRNLRLKDGTQLGDRRLVPAYPTTYILDANSLVVFHQAGPGEHWDQYEQLIRHLAKR